MYFFHYITYIMSAISVPPKTPCPIHIYSNTWKSLFFTIALNKPKKVLTTNISIGKDYITDQLIYKTNFQK